jgi:carbamoyltransferase
MRILGVMAGHDSSVAVINNGRVEVYLKEERLTNVKRDFLPYQALYEILRSNKKPIDYICTLVPGKLIAGLNLLPKKVLKCPIINYADKHHLSHASLAFYNSGFKEALVIVIDRYGSAFVGDLNEGESVFKATYPAQFVELQKNLWKGPTDLPKVNSVQTSPDTVVNNKNTMSIVKVYESATTLIGQHPLENGKTMGLASYGKDKEFVNFFENNLPVDNLFVEGNFISEFGSNTKFPALPNLFKGHEDKIISSVPEDNYQFYADYAYQVQKQTQQEILKLIKQWVDKTGIKKVCLSGGYSLNIVTNGYLVDQLPDVEFYFEPIADDSGISIGAAMHLYREKSKDTSIKPVENLFFQGFKQDIEDIGTECTEEDIANFLVEQKSVAVFNGMAEAGPRALGNRSILFDARNPDSKKIVNQIKKREWYRPFAGIVLEEDFEKYFHTKGLPSSKFMTISFDTKLSKEIPGVVHADNSCRVQTIGPDIPHLHKLLKQFKNKTGCSVLLNTSFNLAGKPLIETQHQAMYTFQLEKIDVLWFPEIGKYIKKGDRYRLSEQYQLELYKLAAQNKSFDYNNLGED